ncbi:DinB family protein [Larkinella arboricola]|uniref:DinB family protein n=1 Tax=Larkinella arboricola TaxID=643671 RepID=A0A327WPI7_LARAB|nr:DinB family protein [Larkinella arboricola]RAJ94278.1 DinB family protein [Larkinella arboricola]
MKKPSTAEYPSDSFFAKYIDLVDTENVTELLRQQFTVVESLYKNLTGVQQDYRYAEGKWSPREMLGHMIDTERIFAYRALCIARGEHQSLPGFDENAYVKNANFGAQSQQQLLNQYGYVRQSTLALVESLPEEAQERVGTANGLPVSARALFAILAGHERHHLNVLAERYGLK